MDSSWWFFEWTVRGGFSNEQLVVDSPWWFFIRGGFDSIPNADSATLLQVRTAASCEKTTALKKFLQRCTGKRFPPLKYMQNLMDKEFDGLRYTHRGSITKVGTEHFHIRFLLYGCDSSKNADQMKWVHDPVGAWTKLHRALATCECVYICPLFEKRKTFKAPSKKRPVGPPSTKTNTADILALTFCPMTDLMQVVHSCGQKIESLFRDCEEEFEVTDVFQYLSHKLSNINCKDFIDNEDVFLQIFKQLNRNYLVGKGLLKYFEKDRTSLHNNTFFFVSQIVLASTPRFQEFSIYLLSSALIKLWKYVEPIENNSWLQSITENSLVDSLRHRIYVILEVIKTPNRKFFDFFASGLQRLALELITTDITKSNFNIRLKEGRLQDSGDIRFLGQKIFIEVAVLNFNGFEQQLASLIDAVFANSEKISIAYVLVDVLIELTIRAHQLLLNCKLKIFENLITGVSSLPAEVSTVIIRSLLPVLNLRAELRAFLLETMKLEICTPKTIRSAFSPLQIILLLFKSLSDQSALRKGSQMSQSFATFSTQVLNQIGVNRSAENSTALEVFGILKRSIHQSVVTKIIVYKGLVDICKKNAVFAVQVMDLLVREAESLPQLTVPNYIDSKTPGITKLPISHLVKELSDLMRLSVHAEARASMAIVPVAADSLTLRAEEALHNVLEMTLECEMPDLTGEKPIAGQVSPKQAFITLLSELCDAMIEYLWSTEYEEMNENTAKKIVNLLDKKNALLNALEDYAKKIKNAAPAAAAKQRRKKISSDFNNLVVKQKIAASAILPLSLELNLQDLEKMLATLCRDDFDHSVIEIEAMRRGVIEWAVEKVYLRSLNLDPFATTCVIPISCFASLAKSLLYLYNNTEDDFCEDWDVLKTYAITGYQKIFTYLTTRYKQRSQDILNDLLNLHDTSFVPSPQNSRRESNGRRSINISNLMRLNQSSNLTNEEITAWDDVLAKHLDVYGTKMIPYLLRKRSSFDERKILPAFQQRVIALVELCTHITFLFPAHNNEMRKHCFEVIQKVVKCHSISDKLIHKTLWKAMFLMVQQSDFSAFYIVFLEKVLTQLITRDEDLSQILLVQYYSLSDQNRDETLLMLIECICNAFQTITMSFTVKEEMQDPIGDEFMSSIFSVTFHLAELVKTIYKSPVKCSIIKIASKTLLTELFNTICTIGKYFQKQEAREWSSVDELAEFVQTILKSIIAATLEKRAEEEGDEGDALEEPQNLAKKDGLCKKDDKAYANYASSTEKLHSRLLMLAKVLEDERFDLKILNQGFRDFELNNSLLIQRLGATDQVDLNEAEVISIIDDNEEDGVEGADMLYDEGNEDDVKSESTEDSISDICEEQEEQFLFLDGNNENLETSKSVQDTQTTKKDEIEDDKAYTQSTINDSAFDWNTSCRMSGLFKKARNS